MTQYKVFRDAVHNMICLHRHGHGDGAAPEDWGDPLLLQLIDTPEMQRLRRISQLGPASRVYPSAEHSRFSHSLGVMHLVKRMLSLLLRGNPQGIDPVQRLMVKTAALLHDLGHGPFSHAFERIHPRCGGHEAWTGRIITGPGEVQRRIRHYCEVRNLDPDAFLQGVLGILDLPGGVAPEPVISQMVCGQLDADRMDYLLRDALFTGVSYGRYDLEWLLHSLRQVSSGERELLAVDISKGATALENYLTARDHMYRQVYDHKTVRALEFQLAHIFDVVRWIRERLGRFPEGTPEDMARFLDVPQGGLPSLEHYLALDDSVVHGALAHWSREGVNGTHLERELAHRCAIFRNRTGVYMRLRFHSRTLFQSDTQSPGSELIEDGEELKALEQFFQEHAERTFRVLGAGQSPLDVPLRLIAGVDHLRRSPYAHLLYAPESSHPIHVLDRHGHLRLAEEVCPDIAVMGRHRRRLGRVFCDRRARREVTRFLAEHFSHPTLSIAQDSP
ncbi:MAG: HD domain-containing protein [Magnetococcus sp. WYHC-3]